jgi:hypothetical protein
MQGRVGLLCRRELRPALGNSPAARWSVDRDDRPAITVLVAEVNQQRLLIMLNPQSMPRVIDLVQDPI